MTRRVLVLGAGFLGWRIANLLSDRGDEVCIVTRSPRTGSHSRSGIRFEYADVGSPDALDDLTDLVGDSAAVIYAVGSLYPAETEHRPWLDLYTSLPPFLATLEALMRAPGARVVFLSSGGTVYGDQGSLPLGEETPRAPSSSYGITKLAAELYLADHTRRFGTESTALRVANAYGPGQRTERGQGAVGAFLEAAVTGQTVPLYGEGTPVRDYVHVDDVALAVALLLEVSAMPGALNVGTGVGTSLRDLLSAVEYVTGRVVAVHALPGRDIDLPVNILDSSRATDLLGWVPRGLHQGLRETWQDMLSGPGDQRETRA